MLRLALHGRLFGHGLWCTDPSALSCYQEHSGCSCAAFHLCRFPPSTYAPFLLRRGFDYSGGPWSTVVGSPGAYLLYSDGAGVRIDAQIAAAGSDATALSIQAVTLTRGSDRTTAVLSKVGTQWQTTGAAVCSTYGAETLAECQPVLALHPVAASLAHCQQLPRWTAPHATRIPPAIANQHLLPAFLTCPAVTASGKEVLPSSATVMGRDITVRVRDNHS